MSAGILIMLIKCHALVLLVASSIGCFVARGLFIATQSSASQGSKPVSAVQPSIRGIFYMDR